MKRLTILLILIISLTDLYSQSDYGLIRIIDNFKNVEDMPYICEKVDNKLTVGCGDSIFWTAIKQSDKIIPYLIDRLNDTTLTKTSVPNFGGNYTIADISLYALQILVWNIPVLELAEDSNNSELRNGFWGYWNYTRRSYENRLKFKSRVSNWYENNKNKLIWINSDNIYGCDCRELKNPAGGHFELKK